MSDRQKVLNILSAAIAPMMIDQIGNTKNGISATRAREVINNLRQCNKVKCRKCEDDRRRTEWWLIEKKGELVL